MGSCDTAGFVPKINSQQTLADIITGHILLQSITTFKICNSTYHPRKFVAVFNICQYIYLQSIAICIFWICPGCLPVLTPQRQIGMTYLLFNIWSKYENQIYLVTYFKIVNKLGQPTFFPGNLEYANELQKYMCCAYTGQCPLWFPVSFLYRATKSCAIVHVPFLFGLGHSFL